MGEYEYLRTSVSDGVGTILLHRPEKKNALATFVCEEIGMCLDEWRRSDDVVAVVITGGEEFFSSGMDLAEYLELEPTQYYRLMSKYHRCYRTLADYPKPTIAAVAGPAFAGGCDLLAHCDIRVVAENAKIGMPQPKYGIHSHFSPLWHLVGLSRAKLMFFTGDHVDAAEAYRIGLADVLVPVGSVVEKATHLAKRMAGLGLETQLRLKEIALRSPDMNALAACDYETAAYRDACADVNARERVAAGLARLREHRSLALSGQL
ncbi:enoyl-CoA hydratase/isomerase family protein [Dactylosporangium sp. NPDC005572]|uniref:enoyl-CoA hydratase/isomerase family protein n=1 Tax=Dactylosporangium sp. NPDC005572 TaxID=3156889 RepID=UPI0033B19EDC